LPRIAIDSNDVGFGNPGRAAGVKKHIEYRDTEPVVGRNSRRLRLMAAYNAPGVKLQAKCNSVLHLACSRGLLDAAFATADCLPRMAGRRQGGGVFRLMV
jgi:hypothetical protein